MSVFKRIQSGVKNYFDKKAEDKSYQDKLDSDARIEEKKIYEEEFKKAANEAAHIRARQDAINKSGLAKLRAINQKHGDNKPRGGFLQNLHEYTQKNLKNREDAIKKAQEMRNAGRNMREERIKAQQIARQQRMNQINQGRLPRQNRTPLFRY